MIPAHSKNMPYSRIYSAPYAEDLIADILDRSNQPFTKLREDMEKGVYKGLGKGTIDEQNIQTIMDKEGVIDLRRYAYDELWLDDELN